MVLRLSGARNQPVARVRPPADENQSQHHEGGQPGPDAESSPQPNASDNQISGNSRPRGHDRRIALDFVKPAIAPHRSAAAGVRYSP